MKSKNSPIVIHQKMEANMDTNNDPIDKHRKLIEHLIVERILNSPTNWYLHSTLFYLEAVAQGYLGSITEEQQHVLAVAASHGKSLQKCLELFTTASRLIFDPPRLNLNEFDLLDEISQFVNLLQTNTKFQIEKIFPAEIPLIKGDKDLINGAFKNIRELILQFHPFRFGEIRIVVKNRQDAIEVNTSISESEPLYSIDENPELFIVQSIAKLHNGEFKMESGDGTYNLILMLPLRKE